MRCPSPRDVRKREWAGRTPALLSFGDWRNMGPAPASHRGARARRTGALPPSVVPQGCFAIRRGWPMAARSRLGETDAGSETTRNNPKKCTYVGAVCSSTSRGARYGGVVFENNGCRRPPSAFPQPRGGPASLRNARGIFDGAGDLRLRSDCAPAIYDCLSW